MNKVFSALLEHPLFLETPRRLTDSLPWHGHIPFAFFLVQLAQPRVIVELGVGRGDSYCAFCQAVDQLGLETRCFGIDTWKGDDHGGLYGESVLDELKQHHDGRYSGFSTLLRSTFDDAAPRFEAGSVDLLHIDGYHTYDVVRHDFNVWLPKLSGRAVVLFHDTAVRDKDFGVWKLWDEVKASSSHFEFTHSHGLGVLLVGGEVPESLRDLCALRSEERAALCTLFEKVAAGHEACRLQEIVAKGITLIRKGKTNLDAKQKALEAAEQGLRELSAKLQSVELLLEESRRSEKKLEDLLRIRDAAIASLVRAE